MNRSICALVLGACMSFAGSSLADVVTLKNGDKLNGKVGTITGGKMNFTHEQLGDITIDLVNIQSYSTDEPARIETKSAAVVKDKITEGDQAKVVTAGGQTLPTSDVKSINPPPTKWTGLLASAFNLQRGNTDALTAGVNALAVLRRDDVEKGWNDRFTFGGAYNYGSTGVADDSDINTDNWQAFGKYDKFFTEKLYGYVGVKVEHDRIALLNYRISPGVGLGYQWIESPEMNFFTEAGASYVFEQYDSTFVTKTLGNGTTKIVRVGEDNNDYIAARAAYHFDRKLSDKVTFFHNLGYVPSLQDFSDYTIESDAGIRATLVKNMFAQFRVLWQYDSQPAEGAERSDLQYTVGIGWTF